jgi:hypothetical protein
LENALVECNAAVKLAPTAGAIIDSRGLVELRLGKLDDALADYNAALKYESDASTFYGRGLVELRKGDKASGDADIATAERESADVAAEFARYGLSP